MISEPKVVLIAGAYGYGNTGDDAILKYLLPELRASVSNLRVIVLSDSPNDTSAVYKVESIHWQDISKVVQATLSCHLLLIGGGGLFYDYWGVNSDSLLTPNHGEISYFAGLALLSRLLNKQLMFCAVGVGPLLTEDGRLLTRVAFEQATLATVRDPESKSLLEQIGVPSDQIIVTADPAFHLSAAERPDDQKIMEAEVGASLQRPIVGAALRQWNVGVDPNVWERATAEALDSFVGRHGGTVVFIPFHRTIEGGLADDRLLANRVRECMAHKEQSIVLQSEYTPEECASLISQCDLVLGMRLHSVIFALKAGVPVVALTYDPKVSNTIARFSLEYAGIDPAKISSENLAMMLESAYKGRANFKAQREEKLRELEALSRKNIELTVELLTRVPPALPKLSESAVKVFSRPAVMETVTQLGFGRIVDELVTASKGQSLQPVPARPNREARIRPSDFARFIHQGRENSRLPQKRSSPRSSKGNHSRKPCVAYLTYMLLDWETRKPRFGGGERYALTLGSLLRDLGFEVTFYQAATERFTGEYYGFPVISIPFADSYSEFQYGLSDEFYKLANDYDYIIYNLAEFATGEIREDALLICHGIWFDHNNYPPPTSYRTEEWFSHLYRAFSRPSKVISVDTNSINVLRALWPELAGRMTYVPNWVDTQIFMPPSERTGERLTVLFPRRSQINRGSRLIGPILERVEQACEFLWVGEGEREETDYIRSVARRNPRLRFMAVPFEQMPRLYRDADICVIPSIGSEGTSLSCLEAMASGCAVIATNVGGLPNLIQQEINGLLVDPTVQGIASALNRLLADSRERSAYQRAGAITSRQFDISQWRKRWINLLGDLRWIA